MLVILKAENGHYYRNKKSGLCSVWVNTSNPERWELVEGEMPIEPEPLTDEEALTRYANELTGADDPDLISAAETLIEQRIKEGAP